MPASASASRPSSPGVPALADRRQRELRRASDGRLPRRGKVLCASSFLAKRPELLQRLDDEGYEVVFNDSGRTLDEAGLGALLPGVVATVAGTEPYNERILAAAPDLRIVARLGVGFDQIDVAAATRHGVAVAMAFGTNHEAVADHTFALMAALASSITSYDRLVRDGSWGSLAHGSLHGTTVGIVGLGRIGRAVAKRCQGFAMRVLAHDPLIDATILGHLGCTQVGLDELLAQADFVSLHAPLLPATRHLIDAAALSRMKSSAYLINTARGPLVDEAALVAALEAGEIAGAGLDVFESEPLPAGSRLRALESVVLSPHAAGMSEGAVRAMTDRCIDSILAHLDGRPLEPSLILNPEAAGV
jgi:phosphoglycerate dehydrogenase-like enzyme